MADGSRHSLFAIAESVYGTTPSTPAFDTLRITGTTLNQAREALTSEEVRSDRMTPDMRGGANNVAGDINFELSYGSFDKFLEAALGGTWSPDTPSAGTDQLKAGTTRRSFSMLRRFDDLDAGAKNHWLFTGCEVNTLSLSIAANQIITGTMGIMGQGLALDTAAPAGATFNSPTTTAVLDSFTGALTEGGTVIGVVTELSLELTNNLEARYVVGDRNSIRPGVGRLGITGTMTTYFQDTALAEKFINETDSAISFSLPDAAGNDITITLPRVRYSGGAQPDVSGEGTITLQLPFTALLNDADSSNIIIERTAA